MTIAEIDEEKYLDFANDFFAKQQREMSRDDFHSLYGYVAEKRLLSFFSEVIYWSNPCLL